MFSSKRVSFIKLILIESNCSLLWSNLLFSKVNLEFQEYLSENPKFFSRLSNLLYCSLESKFFIENWWFLLKVFSSFLILSINLEMHWDKEYSSVFLSKMIVSLTSSLFQIGLKEIFFLFFFFCKILIVLQKLDKHDNKYKI